VDNFGGVSRIVPTDGDFLPPLDKLEKAITAKTKAVLINSPNNPTGVVYSEKLLTDMGTFSKRKKSSTGRPSFY